MLDMKISLRFAEININLKKTKENMLNYLIALYVVYIRICIYNTLQQSSSNKSCLNQLPQLIRQARETREKYLSKSHRRQLDSRQKKHFAADFPSDREKNLPTRCARRIYI